MFEFTTGCCPPCSASERGDICGRASATRHQYPPNHRTKVCRHYLLGECRFGARCSYLHIRPAEHALREPPYIHYGGTLSPPLIFDPESALARSHFSSPSPNGRSRRGSGASSREEHIAISVSASDEESLMDLGASDRTPPPPPPGTPVSFDAAGASLGTPLILPQPLSPRSTAPPLSAERKRRSPWDKSLFYKTKPCRFYHQNGACIKGDRCNFIHESVISFSSSSTGDAVNMAGHALPQRPLRNQERNFYPVTWRVIGGGVMMSGKREICSDFMAGYCTEGDDCKFAHPESFGQAQTLLEECFSSPIPRSPYSAPFSSFFVSPTLPAEFSVYAVSSPLSPLPSPMSYFEPPPPPPPRPHPRERRAKKLTILLPQRSEHQEEGYCAHRVVNGSTLVAQDPTPYEETTVTPKSVALSARMLVRPVSTPPTPVSRSSEVVRLFAAESP